MGWPLWLLTVVPSSCLLRSLMRKHRRRARCVPCGKCYARLDKFLGRKEMPNLGKLGLIFLAAVVVSALAPTSGWSQNVYGTIAGVVTDTSGAAVANATIVLTNVDTAQKRNMETDASGNYTFVNILP